VPATPACRRCAAERCAPHAAALSHWRALRCGTARPTPQLCGIFSFSFFSGDRPEHAATVTELCGIFSFSCSLSCSLQWKESLSA
jgi:hypothetical protein